MEFIHPVLCDDRTRSLNERVEGAALCAGREDMQGWVTRAGPPRTVLRGSGFPHSPSSSAEGDMLSSKFLQKLNFPPKELEVTGTSAADPTWHREQLVHDGHVPLRLTGLFRVATEQRPLGGCPDCLRRQLQVNGAAPPAVPRQGAERAAGSQNKAQMKLATEIVNVVSIRKTEFRVNFYFGISYNEHRNVSIVCNKSCRFHHPPADRPAGSVRPLEDPQPWKCSAKDQTKWS
ncbi:hypothetical protein CB1_000880063 [Camelus ferus]|nr:hypothetical protein CB1_000880063 [Camelus ferus]